MEQSIADLERERGTPRRFQPRSKSRFLAFVWCISVVASCYFWEYSLETTTAIAWTSPFFVMNVIAAGIGSISTLFGIICGSSSIHLFTFGLAMLFISILSCIVESSVAGKVWTLENTSSIVAPSIPPLLVGFCASTATFDGVFASLAPLASSTSAITASLLPLVSLLVGSMVRLSSTPSSSSSLDDFCVAPSTVICMITLFLFFAYHRERTHKHGSLTPTHTVRGVSVASYFAISTSVLLIIHSIFGFTSEAITKLPAKLLLAPWVPFFLGCTMTLFICTLFTATADVWDVGATPQFLMVGLDTASIIIYIITPLTILSIRFVDKYGTALSFVSTSISDLLCPLLSCATMSEYQHFEAGRIFSFMMLFGCIISVGVPLINTLCPLGPYLFAKSCIHGKNGTGRVSLCVHFAHLFPPSITKNEIKRILHKLLHLSKTTENGVEKDSTELNGSLNVFVNAADIQKYPELIHQLDKAGHNIGLTMAGNKSASTISSLSLLLPSGYAKLRQELEELCESYRQLLKKEPVWFSPGLDTVVGRHPAIMSLTAKRQMKVIFWSNVIMVQYNGFMTIPAGTDIPIQRKEWEWRNGGSVIFVVQADADCPESNLSSVWPVVTVVLSTLEKSSISKLTSDSLSVVVKDPMAMEL